MKEIKVFRATNGLKQSDVAEYLGVTKAYICNIEKDVHPLPKKILQLLLLNDRGWDTKSLEPLVEKFNANSRMRSLKVDPSENDSIIVAPNPSTIPVIPMDAIAGPIAEYINEGVVASQCERILSPVAGATCAIRIYGDSMYPKYNSGSVALLREVNENIYIEWGRTYVLDTVNGPVIKTITKGSSDEFVTCSSINLTYEPFEIRKSDILHWYRVLVVMNFE